MDVSQLMFRPGLMESERILVTGGGTGLGREMTEAFLKLGATVYICGRRQNKLDETAQELMAEHGGKVVGIACDIRDADAINAMIDQIWADGPLTGLVNNAAGNFISRTEDLSVNGFNAIADIVFRGTFYVTHNVGKRIIAEKGRCNVLSILTTWVWNGSAFVVPSAMSKSAINTMTQSLAVEWGRHNMRFNAIAPGLFPTKGMSARLSPGGRGGNSNNEINPMGRHGEMHELANLAVFLMGPGAEYVNGQTIAIDGAGYQATGGTFWSTLQGLGDAEWEQLRAMIKGTNAADKADRATG
ncbi:MAG: short-chain dehydrogenase [Altererythrobacter sp. XM-24bin4]|jgi:NAD(P)-dependent dehydrogenase (short-subunit alcohol dehydrogenase family)|uniref:SDR family oxidoreductase n=1 Tax=Altererythrobacter rubellus TaxID=2173831 RepID=A0A9Y2B8L5_9SPHN|nr:SDR family oxidoreductase [Altererythrobacter rubellus]PWL25329.1 MAG: short-chain dehydrogenase [Altererythrobacter sp. XM-24bin4]WIW96001.1 SDR family oxidoreductase [Altererythrobacter rubellus]